VSPHEKTAEELIKLVENGDLVVEECSEEDDFPIELVHLQKIYQLYFVRDIMRYYFSGDFKKLEDLGALELTKEIVAEKGVGLSNMPKDEVLKILEMPDLDSTRRIIQTRRW
jgi:hypothetical protein